MDESQRTVFCKGCGLAVPSDARFCPNCGKPVRPSAAPLPKPKGSGPSAPVVYGCSGCLGVAVALFIIGGLLTMCSGGSTTTSSSSSTVADATNTPDAEPTDQPTDTPEPIKDQKKDFLAEVDESISGAMIAGSPYKYVGDDVDLHCTVMNVPDPSFFNASCGTDSDGLPAVIVVQYDNTADLSKGQAIRVMGQVIDPVQGTNAMGGTMNFPAVQAQFME